MSNDVIGAQVPSFLVKPHGAVDFFDGEDAIDLAVAFGFVPDPWQEGLITGALARTENGEFAAKQVGLSIPRQNGKNGVLEVVELAQMVLMGRRILHTAHEVKTGRKAFLRLAGYFEENDELRAQVKQIRRVNGQEAIFLDNGASCEFIARSKSSGRGFSVDTLVMDEAQELSAESLDALLPTISASAEPQQIITGTPPAPTDHHGEIFRGIHDTAHNGGTPTLFWAEWAVAHGLGAEEIDPDDETLWLQANPALGARITMDAVRGERTVMDDAAFRRERLGMWERERTSRVLPLEDWNACADPNIRDDGAPVVLAVDVSPGRDAASIVAAGQSVEGYLWVDVIENRRGVSDWVIPRLQAILKRQEVSAIMIDVLSPAGSLIEPLEGQGITVSRTGSNIMAAACGQLFDAVMSHDFRHLDQVPLNLAAAAARKRKLGDSWAWNRSNENADITPLVAATLALTGRTYTKRKRPMVPKREPRKVVVW